MCERGCRSVATVGEARMTLFTNYLFGNKNMVNTQLVGGGAAETTFIDQLESDIGLSVF